MATRRPLIVNAAANQIQEISDSDGLIGNGTIPIGGIIMWSGTIANIPTGWALCDGTNSTPNLTDKFIVGAGSGYAVANTGGSANAIVVSHTHTASTSTAGAHTHDVTVPASGQFDVQGNDLDVPTANNGTYTTSSAGSHSHTVTVDSTGSSGINANLPPYYALAFIMRTI